MVLNGARGDEHPGADFRVCEPVSGELGDLAFLCGEFVARLEPVRVWRRLCWLVSNFDQWRCVWNLVGRGRVAELVERFVLGWGDIAERFV